MGTWGAGNLDSDYALDALSIRSSQLVRDIYQRAHGQRSREADEWAYTELFVDLEILFALDGAGLVRGTSCPAGSEVRALAQNYLAAWEAYYLQLAPATGALEARRQVIVATFERFAVLCEHHGGKVGAVPSSAEPPPAPAAAKKPAKRKAASKPKARAMPRRRSKRR